MPESCLTLEQTWIQNWLMKLINGFGTYPTFMQSKGNEKRAMKGITAIKEKVRTTKKPISPIQLTSDP
ncbi:MAG: hypothetical protein D6742_05970 [Cyanobacteria bacterium J069]|nr:MAG: hypothetical protein D6742_05970 [Cyanobacteria bacterium J069]